MTKSVQQLCFEIKGSSAIVTGASSGLGATFAEALAESGVNLVVSARRMRKLEELSKDLEGRYGVNVVPFRCDVTKEEDVKAMVDKAVEENGSLEIIVNNAGTSALAPSTELPLEEWRKVIEVNLTGVFTCARTAAREMMKKRYGKVINVASIYGAVGDIFTASPYYASKGGVVNLTRALAVEWAPHGINVNAIAPGFFPSEMTNPIFEDKDTLNYIIGRTPLNRVGNPIDLKAALIYLASPGSNYVTGQTIYVDGGWTAL